MPSTEDLIKLHEEAIEKILEGYVLYTAITRALKRQSPEEYERLSQELQEDLDNIIPSEGHRDIVYNFFYGTL